MSAPARRHTGAGPVGGAGWPYRTSAYEGAAMPWFPDFVGAIELARQQTRSAGRRIPLRVLQRPAERRHPRPGDGVAGRSGDLRPPRRRGPGPSPAPEVRPGQPIRLARLHATIETWPRRASGTARSWSSWHTSRTPRAGGVVADRGGRRVAGRALGCVPYLLQPMAGRRETASATAHTQERGGPSRRRRGSLPRRLEAGDAEAIVGTFEPDGYVREPIGPHATHRGTPALRTYFTECFGGAVASTSSTAP